MSFFDPTKCKREDFATLFSFNSALWAGELCNKMLSLKNKGYMFFMDSAEIIPWFRFEYGEDFLIGLRTSENCTEMWVGCTHAEVNGEWKVWCSKKELTEIFKRIKVVEPKHFKALV